MVDDDNIASTTSTSQEQIQSSVNKPDIPGRRYRNPLGYFSSSTYQISLYMITPDAYDAFVASGRRQINALNNVEGNQAAGAYLVAQSGGIDSTTGNRMPTDKNLDYYIDNLSIKTYMDPQSTMTSSNSTEIKFQIIEPYGFSFLTRLRNASDVLQEYNAALNAVQSAPSNPSRQFFILGIRFFGYDENGNVMKGSNIYDNDQLDPTNSDSGIFDHYYDINIIGIKFKIDGTATTYNVDAVSVAPQVAFGIKRGRINNDTTVVGTTVYDVLEGENGLIAKLNKANAENTIGIPNTITSIKWLGDGAEKIKNATIVLPEDWDKSKMPMSNASDTVKVTPAAEDSANPNVGERQVIFKSDTAIQQAISQLISQSSYLRNALDVVYNSNKQPDPKTGEYVEDNPSLPGEKVSWYNLSAVVSNAKWNDQIADFVYDITYVIQTYETPVIFNAYTNAGSRYYGPHKRYEYWYTGKNSEILSYEQVLNNGYFTIALDERRETLGRPQVPIVPGRQIDQLRQGKLTVGMEAQNTYITSLYDPGSFVSAKVTIMGDPDFLVMESEGSIDDVYSRFYGTDGYTVKANGGQVFIEIDFKEAVDYDTEKGYLSINDRILFWQYPDDIAKEIKGVSYKVIDVMSNFQGGIFKQTLNCVINTFNNIEAANNVNVTQRQIDNAVNNVANVVTGKTTWTEQQLDTISTGTGTINLNPVSTGSISLNSTQNYGFSLNVNSSRTDDDA